MASVSAGHIILTPTQPVGSGRPQRESNPEPPHQEWRALPTELLRPRDKLSKQRFYIERNVTDNSYRIYFSINKAGPNNLVDMNNIEK